MIWVWKAVVVVAGCWRGGSRLEARSVEGVHCQAHHYYWGRQHLRIPVRNLGTQRALEAKAKAKA